MAQKSQVSDSEANSCVRFIVSHFEQILKAVEFLIAGTKCGFDSRGVKRPV